MPSYTRPTLPRNEYEDGAEQARGRLARCGAVCMVRGVGSSDGWPAYTSVSASRVRPRGAGDGGEGRWVTGTPAELVTPVRVVLVRRGRIVRGRAGGVKQMRDKVSVPVDDKSECERMTRQLEARSWLECTWDMYIADTYSTRLTEAETNHSRTRKHGKK
ncbi:hypothetical protein C8F04DRAFT_1198724 [Mycena alexandri]|uniref:Uncharacterized protein n=1 Tax=Mycena alexandri TaxID=1745969 RepID=A0AAD6WP81_9AGAR|nr:hypothetical protein C8F04DRAFT_1198724 [Mycena alexandri]